MYIPVTPYVREKLRMRRACLLLPMLVGILGCGGSPKLPDTVPVTGVVTLDGKPLDGALVNFASTSNGVGAFGLTNEQGEYKLEIMVGRLTKEGAVPGEYKVTISRFVDPEGKRVKMDEPRAIPGRQSVPRRYSDPTETLLMGKVDAAGGKQDFELKGKR